jgi:hypothetical protein
VTALILSKIPRFLAGNQNPFFEISSGIGTVQKQAAAAEPAARDTKQGVLYGE